MKSPIKLKINLENMPLSVFRRVLVPENTNMMQLHFITQIAMGWEFAHLFQFSDKRQDPSIIAGIPEGDDDSTFDFSFFGGTKESKAEKIKLKKDFQQDRNAKPFWYWYDFGDDWWHKITFQKTTKKDMAIFKEAPVCVEAFGACPPEDVGGPWGYDDFLRAVTDKRHPEHDEIREWAGLSPEEKYDPDYADIETINQSLEDLFRSPDWKMTANRYFKG